LIQAGGDYKSQALDLAPVASSMLLSSAYDEEKIMQILKVSGMSCGHCVRAITRAVQAGDPAAEVQVDLGAGAVRVASRLSLEQLLAAVREEGYAAEPA
jgi:copper chaperone